MYVDDFHPIMKMAEDEVRLHEITSWKDTMDDLKRSIDAWDRIAKYIEPKLKAVDSYHWAGLVLNVHLKPLDP